MANRTWRSESEEIVPGTRRAGYRVHCAQCPTEEFITFGTHSGLMNPAMIEKKFRSRKWQIGRKDSEDLCPICAQAAKTPKPAKTPKSAKTPKPAKTPQPAPAAKTIPPQPQPTPETPMPQPSFDAVSATVTPTTFNPKRPILSLAPKAADATMSREDRRIVFAKLDEVYIDAERGYRTGWHDQKVATDLGVPLSWVKQVRDENFGPETNDEWAKTLAEAKTLPGRQAELSAEIAALSEKFKALASEGQALSAKAVKLALDVERINRAVEAITKAMG